MRALIVGALLLTFVVGNAGCFTTTPGERFYGRVVIPQEQHFRWSDGGLPQIFDPAFAATPPDTDLVRAIFEGLTDYDPRTLAPVPAVATRWESSNGGKTWTFYLREDARWSDGVMVTAQDFVRSWERTARIGDLVPHTELLRNIEGARKAPGHTPDKQSEQTAQPAARPGGEPRFGAEALNDRILRVHLEQADENFPALVAHPVFRPVRIADTEPGRRVGPRGIISNGAFTLSAAEPNRVVLERAKNYWAKSDVALEVVEFVGTSDAEAALAAYRAGEIDAVTNAAFEPLAIKLLAPYQDFRRETYGALTYYSFNIAHSPFDDVRVREALAIAIDRDRISEDDLGGSTEPARKFLPDEMDSTKETVVSKTEFLEKDVHRAKKLLAEAGFPDGRGFPRVRLLINRNEQQRVVSQSIAAMWHTVLNIETDIIMRNWEEYEAVIRAGEYDVVRRGLVMQTTDELTNIRMMFQHERQTMPGTQQFGTPEGEVGKRGSGLSAERPMESEEQALSELKSMPIYFASSYSLVKPYVRGFDANVLDVPSLKTVSIDANWKGPETALGSWSPFIFRGSYPKALRMSAL
ncbi:MAG TPA: peptide ABC transporter substrate-binding protein [Pyrinomonadaceae bacterium]|nr:peptide ABC transporter substrate-binding protein [Pyrinomonadaceae bacterium]